MNTVCVRSAVLVQVISMIGLASASTSSAQLTVAPLPDLQLSKGGKVHAVVVQADGRMIVGGAFRAVNGVPRHNLARINRDGSVDSGWNPDVRGPEGASVHALALHEDAVLVGGRFDQVGGLPRLNVAKVSLAGAGGPDPDWNPGVSAELPAPEPAIVRALVVFGNEVFIGGDFDIVDGRPIRDVARLSLLGNGAADPQWSLALEGRGVWTLALGPVPFGPPVLVPAGAEAEESVTNLYVGGEFALRSTDDEDFAAGDWRHLIRVPVHAPPAPDPAWRPNPNGPVRSLAVGAGTVFAGGTFTEIDGLERLRAARLHVTEDAKGGLVDADWQLAIEPGRQEVDPEAGVAVLWLEQDRLYLGGSFEGVGSQPLRHLIRAAIRGEQLLDAAWRPQPDGPVQALARSESVWLAGGAFEQAGGATALGLARLDGVTGAADAVRTALVQVPGVVRTLVRQADGKLVVGGDFHYAGCEVRRHLARANADGTLDTSWQPNADNEVLALATIGPDLYVGGRFTQIGGMTRHGLARFRAAGPDVPDAQWNPAGPLSEVYAIALDPATNVLVGGRFIEMGGAMRTNLAKLASTNEGTADATWAPNAHRGTLLPQIGVVRVIVPRGTDVFIGGDFRRVSGTARTNLAKLDLATGAADPLWVPNPSEVSTISALAVSGSNVFVGGRFTGVDSISGKSLAKMSADGPAVIDRTWNPMPYFGGRFAFAEALALSGTNLYVAGRFLTIGGQLRNGLARISTEGTGLADPRWDPQPRFARDNSADPGDPFLCALVLHQGNVFAGGEFTAMGHATRFGLALIAELDAPVMVKTGPAAFTVLRGPSDGDEVRHFQITTIEGATLYQSDGRTEVRVRDYITIEQGAAGLVVATNDPYARISAVSAVGTRPEDTGVLEGSLEFGGVQTPVFRIGAPSYFVNEDGFSALMTVEKRGLGPGAVQYVVEPGTAEPHDLDCGIGDYVALPGDTLNFTASETVKTFVVFIVDDDKTEGDETFTFRLTRALGNGQLAGPSFAPVTIVDNEKTGPLGSFTQHERPAPASTASGALRVHLQSPGDAGQWRLEGETAWRDSDDTVRGLSTGTYVVEFKPLPNLTEPPAQAVFVESPQTANLLAQYEARGGPGTAGLKVVIQPDAIARHPEEIHRGQWRLEGESLWRDSDQTYTLPVGNYVIEFKPVPGFVAPASRIAVVVPELQVIAGSYLAAPPVLGQQPAVLPLETVTNTEPYLYNGQVRTEFGVGSGVVVKPRVVLTAAHIVFDDRTLSSAAEMKWHFQRRAGEFEPAPQLARGAFLLAGYATQRTNDLADGVPPGESTPASQAHDVAALYFLERDGDPNLPGRGGFGGFLSSDADPHEWLISDRLKFLAGYPVQRVNPGEAGRLHATSPTNALFTRLYGQVHRTEDFVSFPGASGGPVYVQADDGTYYPAAIYLGGSAISLVRAIDCYVVDLINRAELLANGAGNHGGFGVTRYVAAGSAGISVGLIQVLLGPTSEEQMQGGWRVVNPANPNAPWITDTNLFKPAIGSPAIQPIEFRPLPGRATPAPRDVQFVAGQINVITVSYRPFLLELQPPAAAGHLSFLVHAATGRVYVIEESADLEHWSPVGRLTNTSGTTPLSLPIDPSVAHRFFRGLEP